MRLLLAEDEKALSDALVTILKHNNFSVDAVYNGEDAIDYIQSEIYDCVILDVMMPVCDGFTVLKRIRADKNNVPVIMLTAKSQTEDKVAGLDYGADDYITKPFNSKELLARIRAVTRRQTDVKESFPAFGDLTLNRITFELICKNKKILLTSKEFQIIELMMQNPSRIISSEKFMDKIWGFDSDSDINVVWTYISYIRKKLKLLDSAVKVKAVRNIGYKLELVNDQKIKI